MNHQCWYDKSKGSLICSCGLLTKSSGQRSADSHQQSGAVRHWSDQCGESEGLRYKMLILVWVRWCCLDSSSRSYRGTTPSRVRRTTRTACPASSSSSASSRMADGSPRSCKCSRARPCRWTPSSLPLLMKSSRGRRCTPRMATATSTTTTLPQRRTIAWCHWQRFPGEGFPRVAWATSWAGLYYSASVEFLRHRFENARLTLATFDDEGHCIGHMGSWSFSSWARNQNSNTNPTFV